MKWKKKNTRIKIHGMHVYISKIVKIKANIVVNIGEYGQEVEWVYFTQTRLEFCLKKNIVEAKQGNVLNDMSALIKVKMLINIGATHSNCILLHFSFPISFLFLLFDSFNNSNALYCLQLQWKKEKVKKKK